MPDLLRSDWAHLIPHAGAMCLLDAVRRFDAETIWAVSTRHASADHPLRGEHGLHAVHLIEYGAQAAAVHAALTARERGDETVRAGRLVSVRDCTLHVGTVDRLHGEICVTAQCLYADDSGAQYTFAVECGGQPLASGRVAVIHPRL
ncbi:MAG TPA: phosphotransferase [Dyella sp.]|uniref:phosphotransferase n=1 Tax=Dyella sp. TaxID=1869338 RepID=UPI002F946EFF